MLHELLLALLGFTGDFVIDEREKLEEEDEDGDCPVGPTFRLAPDLSFVDPSQRSAIERLVQLGFYYRELNCFATKSRNLSWVQSSREIPVPIPQPEKRRGSVYRRAIANGIVEILSVYRAAVLKVEQNLLSEPVPILATVTQGLHKFEVLLPPLYELIAEMEKKDIRGGQLLNLLHERCHCGVPELQSCIQRLLWHGHQVMYNQLASWMVYGVLQDPYSEFFIQRQDRQERESEKSSADVEKTVHKSADGAALSIDWHSGYHISLDMLPEYIQMPVAQSILFAGKAVRVLRNPSSGFQLKDDSSNQNSGPKGVFFGFHGSMKDLSDEFGLVVQELLPQSEAEKIDTMLQELKVSTEFHKRLFESAVSSIRTIAATHLWQLVVVRANLNGHLKALKDYFLLAKGDFFQCFLEESRQLMRLPPRQSTAQADLMVPFQLAALKTIGEEDKYFSRVSLRMSSFGGTNTAVAQKEIAAKSLVVSSLQRNTDSAELALDGWDGISLEYSVEWPLQLFFTQEVISKYRKVFQYLIRLKRTQMELERSWGAVIQQDHADFCTHRRNRDSTPVSVLRRRRHQPMWRVREHMIFLIRNLQYYIQVDVIESQWNVLQTHVQESHDFTELVGFHQEYLMALISQSFLDIGSLSRILDSIMKLCLHFCWSLEQQESTSSLSELERITEEFNKKSNSLYTILRSSQIAGSQRAPYLRQFLMRLNFNKFFEDTARGVISVEKQRT
ncbi:gamma-tubulin complex component 4 isoform X1 [Carex littledalei]|uniref:Gamma-tubulin complex component n=1 Tax=Carex littledalei TaxID=544730 RepID=A0A833QJT8_9POAL|nr:gamma-tubulin complex component 4 isoform X1 [Carex littledalei]